MISNEPDRAGGAARRQSPPLENLCGREALARLEEGSITLGRFRAMLQDAPASMHESFVTYFAFLTEVAGAETRRALAELSRLVRSGAAKPRAEDWKPLLDALGREQTTDPVTDDTTLNELSEMLWREHTRQD